MVSLTITFDIFLPSGFSGLIRKFHSVLIVGTVGKAFSSKVSKSKLCLGTILWIV